MLRALHLALFLCALAACGPVRSETARALEAYAQLPAPRALAVAGDGRLAYGLGYGTPGDAGAASMALAACEAARKRYAMDFRCEVTRLNDFELTPGRVLRRDNAGHNLPLWRVRQGGRTLFLAGSIHMLKATLHPIDPAWNEAFEASDALVVEIDPASMTDPAAREKLRQMTQLPHGVRLSDVLPEELGSTLATYLRSQGTSPDVFAASTPVWLATQIQLSTFTALGYLPRYGLEAHFLPLARSRGMDVIELESVDEQLGAMLGYDLTVQTAVLKDTLESVGEAPQMIEALTGAWLRGDPDAFMALFERQSGDSPAVRAYTEALIAARNRRMAQRIMPLLADPPVEFVLVGTAHMGGPTGLIRALQSAGASVEQLERVVGPATARSALPAG